MRACFTLLRHAAGELQVAFAEAGVVDFAEVAQVALRVLRGEDGLPSDAAIAVADGVHHLFARSQRPTAMGTLPRMIQEWRGRKLAASAGGYGAIYLYDCVR